MLPLRSGDVISDEVLETENYIGLPQPRILFGSAKWW